MAKMRSVSAAFLFIIAGTSANLAKAQLTANPTSVTLTCPGGLPSSVSVTSTPSGESYTATPASLTGLSAVVGTGVTPDTVTISMDCSQAPGATGQYPGIVKLRLPDGTGVNVGVTLNVVCTLSVSPSTPITFNYSQGSSTPPPPVALSVTDNSGPDAFTDSASPPAPWLSLSPSGGTTPTANTISVGLNSTALASLTQAGSPYTTNVAVTGSSCSPPLIPVTLNVLLPISVQLQVSPASFPTAAWQEGGAPGPAPPSPQTVNVTTSNGSALSYTASNTDCPNVLTVASPSGSTTPGTFSFSYLVGATRGTYSCHINVTATGTGSTGVVPVAILVPVTVTVPIVSVNPSGTLSFACPPSSSSQIITLASSGGPVTYGSSVSTIPAGGTWLSLTPQTGTVLGPPGSQAAASVNCTGLASGTYSGSIALSVPHAANSSLNLPVNLTVSTLSLTATPNQLSFSYQTGAGAPAPQSVSISTSPSESVAFTTTFGLDCSWLVLAPLGGTTPLTLSASVNTAVLSGNHHCVVSVNSTNGSASATSFEVDATPSASTTIAVAPSLLPFSYQVNGTVPASQAFTVTSANPTAGIGFTLSLGSNCGWVVLPATSALTTPSSPLSISVNPAGLSPATYSCAISVNAPSATNSPQVVTATLTVTAPTSITVTPNSLTFNYSLQGSTPPVQNLSITATGANSFTTSPQGPSCGWLGLSPSSGSIPGTVVASVNPASLTAGTYICNVNVSVPGVPTPAAVQVTLNIASGSVIVVSPSSMPFVYQLGTSAPASQTIAVSTTPPTATSFSASLGQGCGWLTLSSTSGTTPGTINVSINTAGLLAQNYVCSISIAAAGFSNSPQVVSASLTATPSTAAKLQVGTTTLGFGTYQIGASVPSAIPISVTSSDSSSALGFAVAEGSGCSWLALNPTAGTTPATISASLNTTGLAPNSYACTLSIAAGSGTAVQVSASLNVTAPVFSVSPPTLSFSYQIGFSAPSSQTISVTTSGGSQSTATAAGGTWLSVSPGSGNVFTVSVNPTSPANLAPGTYNGAINLALAGSTQTVFVTLSVYGPTVSASPNSLTFSSTVGGATPPAAPPLAISSSSDQTTGVNFTASTTCSWATVNPTSGITPQTLTVSPTNTAGLAQGTYNCSLSVTAPQASNNPLIVPITLTVSNSTLTASPTAVSFNLQQGSTTHVAQSVALSGPATPLTVNAAVSAGCTWLSISPVAGTPMTTPATLNLQANPTGLTAPGPAACTVTLTSSGGQQSVSVSLVISPLPTLAVVPDPLVFHFQAGATTPAPQTLSVLTSDQSPVKFTYTVNAGTAGLSVVPPASGSQNLAVSVDASLQSGSYTGTLTVNATNTSPKSVTVPVMVQVDPPPPTATPVLSLPTAPLMFSFVQGASSGGCQSVEESNQGGGTLSFNASSSTQLGGNWLSVLALESNATPGLPATLSVCANPAQVINSAGQVGTYTGQVQVSSTDGSQTAHFTVVMVVSALPGILLSRSGLTFTVVQSGQGTPGDVVDVLTTGGPNPLQWTASPTSLSGGNWLKVLTASGTASSAAAGQIQVAVDQPTVQNLSPGIYYSLIAIQATDAVSGQPAGNSPQSVTVALNVLDSGSFASPLVEPAGLIFSGEAGVNNAVPQTVQIFNLEATPVEYNSAVVTDDGGNWCSVAPSNATVMYSADMNLAVDFSQLGETTQGIRTCQVRLLFSDGSLQMVSILALPGTGAAATDSAANAAQPVKHVMPRDGGNCQQVLVVALTKPAAGSTLTASQEADLEAKVTDGCNPADPVDTAAVTAFFSNNDRRQPITAIGGGTGLYTGSWTPTNVPPNHTVTLEVEAAADRDRKYVTAPNQFYPITVQPNSTTDSNTTSINAGNGVQVLNSASYDYPGVISPGGLVAIFGANMADSPPFTASTLPLQIQAANAQVLLDGQPVPLQYVSGGQINAQIPFDVNGNATHQLSVTHGQNPSQPQSVTVAAVAPAIYTTNEQGFGQAAVRVAGPEVVADQNHPVKAGDAIEIYCTGLGQVSPPIAAGAPSPTSPLSELPPGSVVVMINNVQANVLFAGLAPGLAGLYQVNAVIPEGVQGGNAVPIVISLAGVSSQPNVTIAVQQSQ